MWTEWRYRFLRMLRQLANVPEGCVVPRWIQFIYHILFPLNWFYERQSGIHYDVVRDIYTIQGMKFSGDVFRHFKQSVGMKFEIEQSSNGTVILRTLQGYGYFKDKCFQN